MNCEKCGAQLPENEAICPECGTDNADPRETATHREVTAVRAQTVPQRPRTSYPDRRTERKPADTRKKSRGKVRVVILVLVIAALLCAAFWIGSRILQNGQEEPDLGDLNSGTLTPDEGNQNGTSQPDDTGDDSDGNIPDTPVDPVSYDLAGAWVWDSDTAWMKETVWSFAEDGTLTIHYFGLGNLENPFEVWPETYSYDKDASVLTLSGEVITLTWQSKTSFTMSSGVLGSCNAKKTDEAHIPTGAVDIRDVEIDSTQAPDASGETGETNSTASAYIFEDSNSRYLSKAECEAHTAAELRIARNEIYARHGRLFDSEDLQAYFDAQDWYEGTISPANFDYTILNDYERYNVNLMKSIEDSKK